MIEQTEIGLRLDMTLFGCLAKPMDGFVGRQLPRPAVRVMDGEVELRLCVALLSLLEKALNRLGLPLRG